MKRVCFHMLAALLAAGSLFMLSSCGQTAYTDTFGSAFVQAERVSADTGDTSREPEADDAEEKAQETADETDWTELAVMPEEPEDAGEDAEPAEAEAAYEEPADDFEPVPSPSIDPGYTYSDVNKTVYAAMGLNVRSGPCVDYDVIGSYESGGEISVTGVCNETGWYRVDYKGTTGYCDANYTVDAVTSAQPEAKEETAEDTGNTDGGGNYAAAVDYSAVSAGDSGVSAYYLGMVQQAYAGAPQWVRNAFENSGWHIYVRSGNWGGEFGFGGVQLKGLTVTGNSAIYISAKDDAVNRQTVCHELGHFVDCIYSWPSESGEFAGIYSAEFGRFCSYYGYTNGSYNSTYELFAEALYHYWTDPGNLAGAAPQTYAYIQKTIG